MVALINHLLTYLLTYLLSRRLWRRTSNACLTTSHSGTGTCIYIIQVGK